MEEIAHLKFLLVCHYNPNGLSAISANIDDLVKKSPFAVEVINVQTGSSGYLELPSKVNLKKYNGVIIHSTVCYFPENLRHLDNQIKIKLHDYSGVKILIKQDEHVKSFMTAQLMKQMKIDLLLTCLPENELAKVYPIELAGAFEYLQTYTGYISPKLLGLPQKNWKNRAVDIVYRGSIQPLIAGRLGFEKRKIGYDVAKEAQNYNLKIDISSNWEDRILGNKWFDFLSNAKAVLGVESGSNLFDFDGSVQQQCDAFVKENPSLTAESEAIYLQAEKLFLSRYENNVNYAQISPRHFEAAACQTLQILYEGNYSNIFEPFVHYIPLKRDLSNFSEIVDYLRNEKLCQTIIDNAYNDIVLNPKYSSDYFMKKLTHKIQKMTNQQKGIATIED